MAFSPSRRQETETPAAAGLADPDTLRGPPPRTAISVCRSPCGPLSVVRIGFDLKDLSESGGMVQARRTGLYSAASMAVAIPGSGQDSSTAPARTASFGIP